MVRGEKPSRTGSNFCKEPNTEAVGRSAKLQSQRKMLHKGQTQRETHLKDSKADQREKRIKKKLKGLILNIAHYHISIKVH